MEVRHDEDEYYRRRYERCRLLSRVVLDEAKVSMRMIIYIKMPSGMCMDFATKPGLTYLWAFLLVVRKSWNSMRRDVDAHWRNDMRFTT